MGDRTHMQVTIYDCPPHQVRAVLDAMQQYVDVPDNKSLTLGQTYSVDEVYCGSADELADLLIEEAGDASFRLWEDPKYEWLGSLWEYTPDLGPFTAPCDADGIAQFGRDWILKTIKEKGTIIGRDVGLDWTEALTALEKKMTTIKTEWGLVGPTLTPQETA